MSLLLVGLATAGFEVAITECWSLGRIETLLLWIDVKSDWCNLDKRRRMVLGWWRIAAYLQATSEKNATNENRQSITMRRPPFDLVCLEAWRWQARLSLIWPHDTLREVEAS
jgi:hypothetical protein